MAESEERLFKGYNGDLIVGPGGVRIERGMKGAFFQGASQGEKMIPWASITAVQYKKGTVGGVGYLQLSLAGGAEDMGGRSDAVRDENTVTWSNLPRPRKKNAEFAEARDLILARISQE